MRFELNSHGQIVLVEPSDSHVTRPDGLSITWMRRVTIPTELAQQLWHDLGVCLNKQNDDPTHLG